MTVSKFKVHMTKIQYNTIVIQPKMLTIEVSKSRTFLTDYKSRIIEIKSTRYSCLFFVTVENGELLIMPANSRWDLVQHLTG